MKVSFFQYQNGLNNGDVINGCGLFLIINFCNFVLRLLLPNDTRQVLQRHIKKVGQKNYKVGQLFPITKWSKIITKWGSSEITKWSKKITKGSRYYKVGEKNHKVGQVLQSGA